MPYTIYVYGKDVYKQYQEGVTQTLSGAECVNFYSVDFPGGINPDKFTIDSTLSVSGSNIGDYTTNELTTYSYIYKGEYKDYVDITYELAAPAVTTLHIRDFQYVDVPVWTQDIVYDGQEHNVSVSPDVANWTGYDTNAMDIGGTITGTDVGSYSAKFTLKDGYAWKDQDPNVRDADVQ